MAMRNTSIKDSKYGEWTSSAMDAISEAVERAPQVIRNARVKESGSKGGMGSKGRAKAGASNPPTQKFTAGK